MPPRTRLVRRQPLLERIKAYMNPWDFLLWISEELNGNDWEDFQKEWSIPIGIVFNVVFMVARANTGLGLDSRGDDVFGDYYERRGSGWLRSFASFVVHALSTLSILNAIYTFQRKRHYRLFEAPIDNEPSTPSAHRVRVDSSPLSSSPLKYLSNILSTPTAASRAHPDATRDVWQVAVWDPTPLNLRLFSLFSPGHILVYWLFLPLAPLDPRPSVTVVTTITLALLLTIQLSLLQSNFSQQAKDSALIQKEVHHEYDTKFVHPNMYKPMRDVATQTPPPKSRTSSSTPTQTGVQEVTTYTPTIIVNRGFHTNPNPAYAAHYDPDRQTQLHDGAQRSHLPQRGMSAAGGLRSVTTPNLLSPSMNGIADLSSPLRPQTAHRHSDFRPGYTKLAVSGDGGSFGIYSHAQSPLKRQSGNVPSGARPRSPQRRESSPLKMSSSANDIRGQDGLKSRFSMSRHDGQEQNKGVRRSNMGQFYG